MYEFFFLSHRTIIVPSAMSSNQFHSLGSPLVGYHEDRPNAQHVQVSSSLAVLAVWLRLFYPAFQSKVAVSDCFSSV